MNCLLDALHHQQHLIQKLVVCRAGSGCGECNAGQPQQSGGCSVPVRPHGGQGEPVAGAVCPQGSAPSPTHVLLTLRWLQYSKTTLTCCRNATFFTRLLRTTQKAAHRAAKHLLP